MKNPSLQIKNAKLFTENGLIKKKIYLTSDGLISFKKIDVEGILDAHGWVIFPNFVNAHTHLNEAFCPLPTDKDSRDLWVNQVYALTSVMDKKVHENAVTFFCLEMISSGMSYVFSQELNFATKYFGNTLDILNKFGLKGVISKDYTDLDTLEHFKNREKFLHSLQQIEKKYCRKIALAIGLIGNLKLEESWQMLKYLQDNGYYIHTHLAERPQTKSRELQILLAKGILNKNLLLSHGIYLNNLELALIKKNGGLLCLNLTSNKNLVKKLPPLKKIVNKDIPILFGTDGGASYTDFFLELNLFGSSTKMKIIDIEKKILHNSLLKSLKIGRLSEGYPADIFLVEESHIENLRPNNIRMMWIDGKIVISDYKFTMDVIGMFKNASSSMKTLSKKTGIYLQTDFNERIERLKFRI